jgi:enoyl-CoA hydratase/carnithine racemase
LRNLADESIISGAINVSEGNAPNSSAMSETSVEIQSHEGFTVLRLRSDDGTNRLTHACIASLNKTLCGLKHVGSGLIIAGNDEFFSAGAELEEVATLTAPAAYEFARTGQHLMERIAEFPIPIYAAVSGYCMGGGLDLALACHCRIAAPNAVFAHRGAALGLVTGWGGTQRLPRLIGRAQAMAMFVVAEKITASKALQIGLVDAVSDDPIAEASRQIRME